MTSPVRLVSLLYRRNGHSRARETAVPGEAYGILSQRLFARSLYIERKRTERSGRGFVLMLVRSGELLEPQSDGQAIEEVVLALSASARDTDIIGWFAEGSAIGVIFTELGAGHSPGSVINILRSKVTKYLTGALTAGQMDEMALSFHVFPEDWDDGSLADDRESIFDLPLCEPRPNGFPHLVKRLIDILGSSFALLLGLPVFLAIAIAIKLTSRGPVLFRQQRVGQFGRKFNFLKFRSMYVNSDAAIHREYMMRFITNGHGCQQTSNGKSCYKLTADPRVTPIGRFLRRTSLDELPQFLNVLMGTMSLVGPRPPLPYELPNYQVWHRARLLVAKPGITGPWQVGGRSRVKFDDMVRMDLRYAASWSLWLDLRILLQTPLAVLSGNGAH